MKNRFIATLMVVLLIAVLLACVIPALVSTDAVAGEALMSMGTAVGATGGGTQLIAADLAVMNGGTEIIATAPTPVTSGAATFMWTALIAGLATIAVAYRRTKYRANGFWPKLNARQSNSTTGDTLMAGDLSEGVLSAAAG